MQFYFRMIICSFHYFLCSFIMIIINMGIGYCVSVNSWTDTESLGDHTLQKRETKCIKRTAEYHVVRTDNVMHVQSAADYAYCIGKRAGDVFLWSSAMPIILWIPSDDHPMA